MEKVLLVLLFFYTNCRTTLIVNIVTMRPIVTIISSANENQPSTMADVPTPLLTTPLPKSCAMTDAATEAVCCHSTETRTKMDETKMMARETWETAREGMERTTRSEPSESSSSYHDGKVARRRTQRKAKMMAMILFQLSASFLFCTYRGKNVH